MLPSSLVDTISSPSQVQRLNQTLAVELSRKVNGSIEVLVEARTATLRGEVASARQKTLAELLVRFEPGVDEIVNEISVANR